MHKLLAHAFWCGAACVALSLRHHDLARQCAGDARAAWRMYVAGGGSRWRGTAARGRALLAAADAVLP